MGYEVLFCHSGAFAHVPVFDYVGRKEIFPDVDLENLSVEEIEGLIGDKKGEFDVIFYARGTSSRLTDLVVLNESSKENMLSVGRSEGNVRLYVAHITNVGKPANFEDGGSSGVNKRYKSIAKRDCGFIESDVDDSSEEEEEDSDDGAWSCSDDELNEIRKMRAKMRKSQKALDEEEAELIRRKLQRSRESGLFGGDNDGQLRGVAYCVNIRDHTCSCRVWELTGVPYAHAISAIKKMRHNPYNFVSHWYKKETYMKIYEHGLEVLRGEPFWEDVQGDTVLPPPMMKKLRGRPKKMRRREGWEGTNSKGKLQRLSRVGRVMHCSFCNGEGHNIRGCKEKPDDWVNPKPKKKGGRKEKVQTEEETEVENIANEHETGEAELMEEALRESNVETQSTPTADLTQTSSAPRQSQRLKDKQTQTLSHTGSKEPQLSKGKRGTCVFMPTPSLVPVDGFGGTPPASTPQVGSSQQSSTVRKIGLRQSTQAQTKKFKVPRKK